jgi:hypothetical protein
VQAVAVTHGGTVTLDTGSSERPSNTTGARFVVRMPAYSDLDDDREHHRPSLQAVID